MKHLLLLVLLFVVIGTLGGCAMMGPDDREFFGRGWINPKELDTPAGARHTPDAAKPTNASTADEPLPTAPSPWDVPGGIPQ